jgi:signal transduction histidine kinase
VFPDFKRLTRFLTRSIPRRILAALLSIFLATYFATAVVVFTGVRASILQSDATALNGLADLKYEQLANAIGELATDLTAWSELEVMNDLVSGDVDKRVAQALEALKRLYGLSGDIYAFDVSGKLLASSAPSRVSDGNDQLPAQWRDEGKELAFVDKQSDPMTGNQIVALTIPVFGSFNKNYRVGTLVLTYPWASIERLLFGVSNATLLLKKGNQIRILAANRVDLTDPAALDRLGASEDTVTSDDVVGRSLPRPGIIGHWQVLMLHDAGTVTRALQWVALKLVLLGACLGIPIVLLGRWLSHRLTAPIADLDRVVREIADTDKLDARVPITSSDELGSLARSFNRMTDNLETTTRERERFLRELAALNQTLEAKVAARTEELEAAVNAQRRLIGDISHEIKSPLARLSMALGLARRSAERDQPRQFDRMEREIDSISALASELLTLARLNGAAAPPEFAPVDLAMLVEQIAADAAYETPGRKADLWFDNGARRPVVVGNAALLSRAIENVVRNAIFYTTEDTRVEIDLFDATPEMVRVEVKDHGPGVPEAALEHLFEPFYRVDEARTRETGGTGIGLAICQRIIHLHGGAVGAKNNTPHGLVVTIELPSAVASHAAQVEGST